MHSNQHITMTMQQTLADFVLIGEVGCGKTALMKALLEDKALMKDKTLNKESDVQKTQAVVFHPHNVIDTPGEFIGRRSYYGALLATIVNVSTIVYLHAANSCYFSMPSGLINIYPNKQIVGVISKVDLPDANVTVAIRLMKENGIPDPYFETSTVTHQGVENLRLYLLGLRTGPENHSEKV